MQAGRAADFAFGRHEEDQGAKVKRSSAVAGRFYHADASRLAEQVKQYTDKTAEKEEALGILVPHAGLMYSGSVAGAVYSSIRFPKTFVMLGPNHTGLGPPVSLMDEGRWESPLATFETDRKLAAKIVSASDMIVRDAQAHLFEHSLEVQLPFIAYFSKEAKIVPVAIMSASLDECRELGSAIAGAVRSVDYPVVLLASSDMSHFIPEQEAKKKDQKAIGRLLAMDPEGLYGTVIRERITMCGYLPATVMLFAAKELGAGSCRLVKYATSGEVSGDFESVVGYAGLIIR